MGLFIRGSRQREPRTHQDFLFPVLFFLRRSLPVVSNAPQGSPRRTSRASTSYERLREAPPPLEDILSRSKEFRGVPIGKSTPGGYAAMDCSFVGAGPHHKGAKGD